MFPKKLPAKPSERCTLSPPAGSGMAFTLATLAQRALGSLVVVVSDPLTAERLERELPFFLGDLWPTPILHFPDWETLPYDTFSPHQDIISERLHTLSRLLTLQKSILVVPVTTLMHRLPPKDHIAQNTLTLEKGDAVSLAGIRHVLEQAGYQSTRQVITHGEFAIRGSIVDLFPMGSQCPFRIDFFGDDLDSIRTFDVETQRSLEVVDHIRLLPGREYPTTEAAISRFRTAWRTLFAHDPKSCPVYLDVSQGNLSAGIEYYLPLFFEHTGSLFEYLPRTSLMVCVGALNEASEAFWHQITHRYEQYSVDRRRPILAPQQLFLRPSDLFTQLKQFPQVHFLPAEKALPDLSVASRHEAPFQKIEAFLNQTPGRVLFCAESIGRCALLKEVLGRASIQTEDVPQWSDCLTGTARYAMTVAPLEEGMCLEAPEITVITESDLLGKRVMQRRRRQARAQEMDTVVRNLAELQVGDPVVHSEHGVGRYLGLKHLVILDQEGEFVTIEYDQGDKLYVPVASLHLISRYSGTDLQHAPWHRLGSEQWQKAKRQAAERARDVAAELLDIYARRAAKQGTAFQKPVTEYEAFCAGFPFEETLDQRQAIDAVLKDLSAPRPMDRLVCGDVGFGKTEVALRAAFVVVHSGKQAVMLVPTTLLAQQHYQTFCDRFAGFPIRVEMISRFRTRTEQTAILAALAAGQIDIIIGTHKLLQESIHFKSLGLLMIDEEHRFGVRQKEALKSLRSEIDILTLTATPIPRTLNMALAGMRDLSMIATPPARRLSIKTFVREYNTALIQEAIEREIHRGGQVYFLHNSVETIYNQAQALEALVPMARISVAHGQMRERELEKVMSDFYHRRFNVLVCTTIIETGIDVPTANTMIIHRADKFGLAQLHQLRGRVGRSHHQAYAFCLTPPQASITGDAQKRLEAIAALEDLGAGFTLATHDLEIRGAGEFLGAEQSGHVQAVGFNLYMEMLEQAVQAMQRGEAFSLEMPFKKGTEIDLQLPALIPENYLPDVAMRLGLYKRIAHAKTQDHLDALACEMIDRFGRLPSQTKTLLEITGLRLMADTLGVCKVEVGSKGGRIEFASSPRASPQKIVFLLQTESRIYTLDKQQRLCFQVDLAEGAPRIAWVKALLLSLQGSG